MPDQSNFFAPEHISEAFNILNKFGEEITLIAGGTDILPNYPQRAFRPKLFVDLTNIRELTGISGTRKEIVIGAAETCSQIVHSEVINKNLPLLVEAAKNLGSPQCRNLATIGGNLVSAVPSADLAPPLLAYDAKVALKRDKAQRDVNLADFFTGPKETVINTGEILTKVIIPLTPWENKGRFFKIGRRNATTLAVVNGAVLLLYNGSNIKQVRIALGAVAPTPLRVKKSESIILKKGLTRETIDQAVDETLEAISPISDIRGSASFRKHLVKTCLQRALREIQSELE